MVFETFRRDARVGRRRLRSRDFRESIIRFESDRFNREVQRVVDRVEKKTAPRAVEKLAIDLARTTMHNTPAKTGRARAGWLAFPRSRHARIRVGGSAKGRALGLREGSFRAMLKGRKPGVVMVNAVPYIMPLEVGSRTHPITAGPGKMLRFIGRDGTYVFRKRVQHPGTRAYRSLRRSMRHMRRALRQSFDGLHEGV
jgi:hypothetical protein